LTSLFKRIRNQSYKWKVFYQDVLFFINRFAPTIHTSGKNIRENREIED